MCVEVAKPTGLAGRLNIAGLHDRPGRWVVTVRPAIASQYSTRVLGGGSGGLKVIVPLLIIFMLRRWTNHKYREIEP